MKPTTVQIQLVTVSRSRLSLRCLARTIPILALLPGTAFAQADRSQVQTIRGGQLVGRYTPTVVNIDLRDLPLAPQWRPGDPIKEIPRRHNPAPGRLVPPGPPANPTTWLIDPLLDLQRIAVPSQLARVFTTPTLNFSGQGFTGVAPPDTVGDIGVNYYIQMINSGGGSQFTIYDKTNGNIVAGPTTLDSLGSGACANGLGDPIVLFDPLAQRWLLSEFCNGNCLCVYISQTADPIAGGWFNYEFGTPFFPDYPKYGVWPDAYYVGSNESSPAAYALERTQMLAGGAAAMVRLTAPSLSAFGFQNLLPSDLDGSTPPPGGSPNYLIRHRDDEAHNPGSNNPNLDFLEIWEFSVDFATPSNSTLTGPFNIGISEIDSELCGFSSFSCFTQPGGGSPLDPLREVAMFRLQYRNFGTHETLVGNLVTDVDGTDHGGVRWFELRKSQANPSWSLFQEGTVAPDADHRWMGSIAMDDSGNMALGYSVSGTGTNPGIRYTGRLATDPANTMPQPEVTIINGGGPSSTNRWGDYSSMNLDPVDGCTFWYTNEYATANGTWATQIASFSFIACGCPFIDPASNLVATANGANRIDLTWTASPAPNVTSYTVLRKIGQCPTAADVLVAGLAGTSFSDTTVSAGSQYFYEVLAVDDTAGCSSDPSNCANATATGLCTQPPVFAGLASVTNAQSASCSLVLSWNAATTNCTANVLYNIYRSTTAGLVPGPGTLLAACVSGTSFIDASVASGIEYFYVVRAEDDSGDGPGGCGGNEDGNLVERSGIPSGPPTVQFQDDMEAGSGNWSISTGPNDGGGTSPWSIVSTDSHSPINSFFVLDENSVKDQLLAMAAAVSIPPEGAMLEFWHRYDTESTYDGGVLEYSRNGGASWQDILSGNPTRFIQGGYNSTLDTGFSNPLPGRSAWSGSSGGFVKTSVLLADFAGQNLLFRWRFGCDSSVSTTGWWVDDVMVVTAQPCTAGPDCNTNGIPDATDIASGTSFDCNANAVPDECETITLWDFNNDSLIDVADHTAFANCLGGPSAGPNGPPECVNMCLDAFDADVSGTIDLKDFGDFGRQF